MRTTKWKVCWACCCLRTDIGKQEIHPVAWQAQEPKSRRAHSSRRRLYLCHWHMVYGCNNSVAVLARTRSRCILSVQLV